MEITIVRQENKSFFEPLMPVEQWQLADLVLGAIEEGTACGVLAVQEAGTFLEIHYLYVAEDYRRKGIATGLLRELHRIGRRARMDGELCQFVDNEVMKGLDACFAGNRYERDEAESTVYVTSFCDVSHKFFSQAAPEGSGSGQGRDRAKTVALGAGVKAVPLSAVTARLWNQFLERLEGLPDEEGNIPSLDSKYLYDQDASFLLVKRGEAAGCSLFERTEDGYIFSYFCVLGKNLPPEMMALLGASYGVLKEKCHDSDKIYVNVLTKAAEKLVLQLTERKARPVGRATARYYIY